VSSANQQIGDLAKLPNFRRLRLKGSMSLNRDVKPHADDGGQIFLKLGGQLLKAMLRMT
jgi:hypothetical protein